ncbi:MAG: general stress protein [Candidatus Levybacteria bacterium]|nr:general stress protein [Candidatus Levybacteria bacterium]
MRSDTQQKTMQTVNELVNVTKNAKTLEPKKGKQGFASMSRDAQRAIASSGGKAAHRKGTAHTWSSKEAAEAGRKGGKN